MRKDKEPLRQKKQVSKSGDSKGWQQWPAISFFIYSLFIDQEVHFHYYMASSVERMMTLMSEILYAVSI